MPTETPLSTSTAIIINADHKKGLKAGELFRAQYNNAELDEDSAQFLNENPDFPAGMLELIKKCAVSDQFADEEERSSTYVYPKGYSPKIVGDQIDILRAQWPSLNPDSAWKYAKEVLPGLPKPTGAEAPFCDIRPDFFNNSYNDGVVEVLAALKTQRKGKFKNWREGQLGSDRLQQHPRTISALDLIRQQQPGDILIHYGQVGMRHRGRSVRRVRVVFAPSSFDIETRVPIEFGYGSMTGGCVLLTHPARLVDYNDLWMDLSGDRFDDPVSGVRWDLAPYLGFGGGELVFDTYDVAFAYEYYGSTSGWFVPQK